MPDKDDDDADLNGTLVPGTPEVPFAPTRPPTRREGDERDGWHPDRARHRDLSVAWDAPAYDTMLCSIVAFILVGICCFLMGMGYAASFRCY